jgi:predicted GTPase
MNTLRQQINIVLIGAVSAGKSTLTNALFVDQFSDMHIRRTTALPQIYNTIDDESKMCDSSNIIEENRKRNTEIMDLTSSGEKELKLDDITEINYYTPNIFELLEKTLKKNVHLNIYDLPGLNDAQTKSAYFEYVSTNFYKFDIVIFVVDIYSSLNSSDEMDILKLILTGMKNNSEKYNISNKLIVLLNKCDDMELNENSSTPKLVDPELEDMKSQVETVIEATKKEIFPDADISVACISCEDAYVYRMVKRNSYETLDKKYRNKLGANEFGKSKWNRMSTVKQNEKIADLFKEIDYDIAFRQSGFLQFEQILKKSLIEEKQYDYVSNHIKYNLSLITNFTDLDIKDSLDNFHRIRVDMGCIDYKFDNKLIGGIFEEKFSEFMKNYEGYHEMYLVDFDITTIIENNIMDTLLKIFKIVGSKFGNIKNVDSIVNIIQTNINKYTYNRTTKYKLITKTTMIENISKLMDSSGVYCKNMMTTLLKNLHKYPIILFGDSSLSSFEEDEEDEEDKEDEEDEDNKEWISLKWMKKNNVMGDEWLEPEDFNITYSTISKNILETIMISHKKYHMTNNELLSIIESNIQVLHKMYFDKRICKTNVVWLKILNLYESVYVKSTNIYHAEFSQIKYRTQLLLSPFSETISKDDEMSLCHGSGSSLYNALCPLEHKFMTLLMETYPDDVCNLDELMSKHN